MLGTYGKMIFHIISRTFKKIPNFTKTDFLKNRLSKVFYRDSQAIFIHQMEMYEIWVTYINNKVHCSITKYFYLNVFYSKLRTTIYDPHFGDI